MAVVTSTVLAVTAAVAVGVTAYSMHQQQRAASRAQDRADRAAEEQKRINAEQRASQAAQAAQERRKQVREERIRRARIMQSAENTGVTDSSGALGSVSALSTNLGANLGFNLGEVQRAGRIGGMMDRVSDYTMQSQRLMNTAAMWGSIGSFSSSIFSNVGGFGAFGLDTKAGK